MTHFKTFQVRNALEGGICLKLVFLTLTFPYIILKFKKVQNIVQLGSQSSFYNLQKKYRIISGMYIFQERGQPPKEIWKYIQDIYFPGKGGQSGKECNTHLSILLGHQRVSHLLPLQQYLQVLQIMPSIGVTSVNHNS